MRAAFRDRPAAATLAMLQSTLAASPPYRLTNFCLRVTILTPLRAERVWSLRIQLAPLPGVVFRPPPGLAVNRRLKIGMFRSVEHVFAIASRPRERAIRPQKAFSGRNEGMSAQGGVG